ncbi:hypothetical protein X777_05084 [Ooceraea biroi]|uniref:Uncharacterized protein n=1 Tax=Ooceraea biroi TaxID=2015173 RepID=A0A026WI63_OOCBI|nr:hypothetical protein X777_05084 [Ooceraea biroi]
MHGVAESETGMAAEDDARLPVVAAESLGPRSIKHDNKRRANGGRADGAQDIPKFLEIVFTDRTIRRGCSSKPRTSLPPAR